MKPNEVTAGLYRLTQTITNPKPDRRVKNDWRERPVFEAGSRFSISVTKNPRGLQLHGMPSAEETTITITPANSTRSREVAYYVCGGRAYGGNLKGPRGEWVHGLLAALEPVAVDSVDAVRDLFPTAMSNGRALLKYFVLQGHLTVEQVHEACRLCESNELWDLIGEGDEA